MLILTAIKLLDRPQPGLNFLPQRTELSNREEREALRFSLYRVLFDYGIDVEWISGDEHHKQVRIPRDLPLVEAYTSLVARFRELGGRLLNAKSSPIQNKMMIELAYQNERLFDVVLVRDESISRYKGKIAIIVDDFGNAYKSPARDFLTLGEDLAISILPGLKYSRAIAQEARENGLDVLLHLPMEPRNDRFETNQFMLRSKMDEAEIRRRVRLALAALPQAVGVNNHMGSHATTDTSLLGVLFDELRQRDLFFVDSKTTPKSVACEIATELGVNCVENYTFVDAIKEKPFVRQQLIALAERAARSGSAVGIAHPEEVTLQVLRTELPVLAKRGYQFVGVSELLN